MKYNPSTREQEKVLKDGRTIFKTHNGFRAFMTDQHGVTIPITQEYYHRLLRIKSA
jgi:hypothetical protein